MPFDIDMGFVLAAQKGSSFWSAASSCQRILLMFIFLSLSFSTSPSNPETDLAIVTSLPCFCWWGNSFLSFHFFSIYLATQNSIVEVSVGFFIRMWASVSVCVCVRTCVHAHVPVCRCACAGMELVCWLRGSGLDLDRLLILCLQWNCKRSMGKVSLMKKMSTALCLGKKWDLGICL